eukprot:ANDGO_00526.mRNA.1 hypothetical protein
MSSASASYNRVVEYRERLDVIERRLKVLVDDIDLVIRGHMGSQEKLQVYTVDMQKHANENTGILNASLTEVTRYLAELNAALETLSTRLQAQCRKSLKQFRPKFEHVRRLLRQLDQSSKKALDARGQLDKLENAANKDRAKIARASSEYEGAKAELQRVESDFELEMVDFERERALLMKGITTGLAHANIAYHAKALDLYTRIHAVGMGLDVENAALQSAAPFRMATNVLSMSQDLRSLETRRDSMLLTTTSSSGGLAATSSSSSNTLGPSSPANASATANSQNQNSAGNANGSNNGAGGSSNGNGNASANTRASSSAKSLNRHGSMASAQSSSSSAKQTQDEEDDSEYEYEEVEVDEDDEVAESPPSQHPKRT